MADAAAILKRLGQLKTRRSIYDSVYRDCADFSYPLRGDGFAGQIIGGVDGQNRQARLLDSTLTDSCDQLVAAIHSGLTPSSSLWFGMEVQGADSQGENWLEESCNKIFRQIHSANFDAEAIECLYDMMVCGYFVLYVDEDSEQGGYNFQHWASSQCYFSCSKPGRPADTIYREYVYTAAQAAAVYGEESLSEDVRKLLAEKPDAEVEFIHVIEPRDGYIAGAKLARNLPFASCHIEVKSKHTVRESGYHEFPCVVGRWRKVNGRTDYTIGPVYNALPDARELNGLVFNEKAATDLAVSGMWIAEDDGVLNPRSVKVGPRKIIVANSVDSMKPLLTGADFNVAFTKKAELQAQIRRVMMADQLPPMDGPVRTATELNARIAMIRQLLGPIFGRLMAEYLQPLIQRCFGIAYRAGALGAAPDSLRGRPFAVKYRSPMARAQQQEDVAAIERMTLNVQTMAQVDPSVIDVVDFDEATALVGKALGVPAKIMRDKEAVDAIRQQRQEQADQQKAEAMVAPALQQSAMNAVGGSNA